MASRFRKSIRVGLVKINFSKSGITYSFGVKGVRINKGRHGTCVNIRYNGIHYQRKIESPLLHEVIPIKEECNEAGHTITSAAIGELTDSDSRAFINELEEKSKKITYFKWFGILPAVLFFLFFFSYFVQTSKEDKVIKYFIAVIDSDTNVNIRQGPNKKSKILGPATTAQNYDLIDTIDKSWNKIKYGDSVGYVAKQFSRIDSTSTLLRTYARFETDSRDFISCLCIATVFFIFLCVVLYKQDRKRLLVDIHYVMDARIKEVYDKFLYHFNEVIDSRKIWQYLHTQRTTDYKHNAGAGNLINRVVIQGISPNKMPARFFRTNVNIPNIKLKNTDFYFFPERLVVRRGNTFAAVFYKHLNIDSKFTRFIEEDGVPSDSKVVDYTWKYLNKNGSPDRRFNNNRKLPICLYSEYTITSDTGVYEVITTSKQGAFDNFAHFINAIGSFQNFYTERT